MAKIGDLSVKLTADIDGFKSKLKDAESSVTGLSTKVTSMATSVAKGVGGIAVAVGAAAGSISALVLSVASSAKELQNLSNVANTNVVDFQKMAFGAQQFGIEQDKLADILKDTTEKLGEYTATGGGGMKDFFENVAPAIGVTVDQFKNLSGKDALQLYISSLEKANLSQDQMTFYLESLASDATLLIPLLKDNGKQLEYFNQQAVETNNVLSELEIKQLIEVKKEIDLLTSSFTGMKNEVAVELLPIFKEFSGTLSDPQVREGVSWLAGGLVNIANAAVKAAPVVKFMVDEVKAMAFGAEIGDVVRLQDELENLNELKFQYENMATADGRNVKEDPRWLANNEEIKQINEKIKLSENLLAINSKPARAGLIVADDAPKPKVNVLNPVDEAKKKKEQIEAEKELQKLLDDQANVLENLADKKRELENANLDLTESEKYLLDLMASPAWSKFSAETQLQIQATADHNIELEKTIKLKEKQKSDQDKLNKLLADTPTEKLKEEAELRAFIKKQLDDQKITQEQYNELINNIDTDKLEAKLISVSTVANDAAKLMTDSFIDFATSGDTSFEDFAKNFLANIAEMIAQAILLNMIMKGATAMAGSDTDWISGLGKIIIGSQSANGNVFANGNLVPFANGGIVSQPTLFPMSNGKTGLMGEAGIEGILPLTRINGKLGVHATGAGTTQNTVINNVSVTVQGGNTNEQTGTAVADVVMRAIARQEISNAKKVGGINNPVRQGI